MDRYRTTANQRELDPSFSVPCRRCAGLLQEWNRFCPFCLEDQFAPADADGPTMAELARDGSPADQTGTAAGIDFVDTVQPGREGREEAVHFAGRADSMSRAMRDGGVSEISLTQPSDYWQTEVLRVGDGKKHWAARLLPGPRPLGIAVVLVLIAVAFFGLKQTYFDARDDAGRLLAFKADTERVQTALNRGDLTNAAQGLEVLEAGNADDPGVQTLRQALDLRIQERSTRRGEPPEAAARMASNEPALDEAAAPVVAMMTPERPAAGTPAPGIGTGRVPEKECSVTLAALALCPKE